MSIASLLGINTAMAAPAAAGHSGGSSMFTTFLFMIVILVAFYFLLIRPQQKRAKEQRDMLNRVALGDEVVTIGGIVGKVSKLRDDFIVLQIADQVEITLQKSSVANVLPKGTFNS